MKEFINKIKKIDKTKRIVILFITISFVFIGGFSIYNGVTGNYQDNSVAQVSSTKDKKEKNTKEKKEEKQSEEVNQTEEKKETTQKEEQSSSQENNKQTSSEEKKESTNNEKKSANTTVQSSNKNSNVNHSQSSTSNSQTNGGQTSSNQSQNSSSNTNQQPNTEKINVSIQVIGIGNTMMSGTLNVDKNSNALSVLKTLAAKNGKEVAGSDYYVSGIGGLYEKQHGPMSGWMYSVNGVAPNKAAIKYNLNDGDKVVWYYVNYN